MSKICDMPFMSRPREKAIRYGVESLSDSELLALIIRSGVKEKNVLCLATELLTNFGGLNKLVDVTYTEFLKINGLNKAKAIELKAVFEIVKRTKSQLIEKQININNIEYLYSKYLPLIENSLQENLYIIVLNKHKKIIFETKLYIGTNEALICSYKEIIKTVLVHDGYYFYLLHNHPSDNFLPSDNDIKITNILISASNGVGIHLLDHIIMTKNGYYSMLQSK